MQQEYLLDYTLHLADNSLIMGHRLSEWAGHGPMLEQDIALSNIALDLIGQARNFYQYAAQIKNDLRAKTNENISSKETEDTLAYLRNDNDFKNCILTELPNGDWGFTILKIFFFSNFQFILFEKLKQSADNYIAAIAEKSLKETAYHLRWSAEWVIRLSDGTNESRQRMLDSLKELHGYINEFFHVNTYEGGCAKSGIGIDPSLLKDEWVKKVTEVFKEATLPSFYLAEKKENLVGKDGRHTENLQHILADMQMLQRIYPGSEW